MCVDATDPEKGNWLRYVNWARSGKEQNLFPLEINRTIYYKTLKVAVPLLISVAFVQISIPCLPIAAVQKCNLLLQEMQHSFVVEYLIGSQKLSSSVHGIFHFKSSLVKSIALALWGGELC